MCAEVALIRAVCKPFQLPRNLQQNVTLGFQQPIAYVSMIVYLAGIDAV
jgi:hypothetical protein